MIVVRLLGRVALAVLTALPLATSAPASQPSPRVLQEELRIVSRDSAPQTALSNITDLVVASDGAVFVLDAREGKVRVFDSSGRFVNMFGRLGSGPGELTSVTNFAGVHGDTVLVYDQNRGHIYSFRRNGTYLRTQKIAGAGQDRTLVARLTESALLMQIAYFSTSTLADSNVYRTTDEGGRELKRLAGEPIVARGVRLATGSGGYILKQPFVATIQGARDGTGTRAVLALPPQRYGGNAGEVKLVILTGNGIQREHVVNVGARRLATEMREAWIEARIDPHAAKLEAAGTPRAAAERNLRDQLAMPDYVPDVETIRLGLDGSVWLRRYGNSEWVVVNQSGQIASTVNVPDELNVHQVSLDRLWGIRLDKDDLPIIVRYRVVPSR